MTVRQQSLPTDLYTAAQVRELDRIAIEEQGIPGLTLMQRAGQAAYDELRRSWPTCQKIAVVCGLGNNAGDGYVLARLAEHDQIDVTVIQIGDVGKLTGDAKTSYEQLNGLSITFSDHNEIDLDQFDVIVDAVFGTGLDREVTGDWASLIQSMNDSQRPILALDIPSGLNADTGMPLGMTVEAEKTITFIGMKQGLLTGQAADYFGQCVYSSLKVPETVFQTLGRASAQRINFDLLKPIPPRKASSHKGDCGHVLLIGGDQGYAGAVRMAAEAAARCGAGLVSVATHKSHANILNIGRPELMVHAITVDRDLDALLHKATVVAIGPGLGQSDWAKQLIARVAESKLPQIWDADALNLLAEDASPNQNRIITPHPGEAARLLASTVQQVQSDRFAAIHSLQQQYSGVVVLKGFGSLVIDQEQDISVCTDGNSGMASGGMGDVLTGVISGFLAQGCSLSEAAKLGVCLHSAAADEAAELGQRGMLASDLFPYIRFLLNH